MTRLATFLCAILFCSAAAARTAVWIDTDPATGAPWREVDDAFALVLAFHSPELRIVGLSTTYGNASLPRTTAVTQNLVRRFGGPAGLTTADIQRGASDPHARSARSPATAALAGALRKERLTYIALGPLTNLAAFLQAHPDLAPRLDRVILIGSRSPEARFAFGPKQKLRVHDANLFKDPAAAAEILAAKIPLLLVPMELAPQLALTPADLRRLKTADKSAGDFLFRRTRVWSWFWTRFVGEKGGLVFDLLAILPALRSDLIQTEPRFAAFDPNGDLVAHREARPGRRRVQFAVATRPGAKAFVLERLRRRPND